ncbi:MAG: RnfABCDGE type electron transport complex subunit B [Ruminococcaceae bacterium]|nr:RnfABCDGE type electron transport complex subunit B [Oscillospiraceae bacterium]MBQ6874343.1 RnfABCDGE type electron transport complex subunit B [Clostridia bacterium]
MESIITAVIIVAAIGLIAGLGLAVASIAFAVPVDEKAEAIRECLPGANCGACGFSGCDGYAAALSSGEATDTTLCSPGGNDAAKAIAEVLGVSAGDVKPKVAVVLCQGNHANVNTKLDYNGVESCKMAAQLFGGPKDCIYGCLGYGDCVKACPYEAIFICDGVARINPDACKACKMCINTCPKNLIELLPLDTVQAGVFCKNRDKGAKTRKQCKVGCIGCMKCVKACEYGAVSVKDNVAHVDYEKCIGCGKCAEACPVKAINLVDIKRH